MHGVQITVGGSRVNLVPSLRAAISLHKRFGIDALIVDVLKCKVSALRAVVEACAIDADPDTIDQMFRLMLRPFPSEVLIEAVTELSLGLVGASVDMVNDDYDAPEGSKDCKITTPAVPCDFAKVYRNLFAVGTGWLGWSAKETLDATPGQILAARDGRIELLKSIFGSNDKAQSAPKPAKATSEEAMDRMAMRFFRAAGMVEA